VKSLGILHAPGYPGYVLLARLWGTVLPFGDWAMRMNLFSVVCATGATVLVYVLGRQFDARRGPAALGALALATSVSFWFNAAFAKHYALSAALVVAAAVLVVWWERDGGSSKLVAAGVVIGFGTGASWELMAIMTLGLVAYVAFAARRIAWRDVGFAAGAAALVALALWSFVLVRAGQDPEVNFGRATTADRIVDLVSQRDFQSGANAPSGTRTLQKAPSRAVAYTRITVREVGIAAVALAAVGAVLVVRRRRACDMWFFGVVMVANVAGAVFISGLEHDRGMASGLVVGGFLIDLMICLSVLVALGATALVDFVASRWRASWAGSIALATLFAVVLVPSLIVHREFATHDVPPFADNYARRILATLPPDAVLVTEGWEWGQPIRYRQIVHGEAPDVQVVSFGETQLDWYREILRSEAPDIVPADDVADDVYLQQLVDRAREAGRPVFVDWSLAGAITAGGRIHGDLVELTDDPDVAVAGSLEETSQRLHAAQAEDGWLTGEGKRFPNRNLALFEARAAIVMAKLAAFENRDDLAALHLRDALAIRPDLRAPRAALQLLERGDPDARDAVLALTGADAEDE